ncbi:Protein of unknown function [Gryllus bimaculatus]|nr:Protein of unknown function [Gryllus bimaculatus]
MRDGGVTTAESRRTQGRTMRNSSLLKWAQAGTSGKSSSSASSASGNSAVNGSAQANSGGGAGAHAAAKDGECLLLLRLC